MIIFNFKKIIEKRFSVLVKFNVHLIVLFTVFFSIVFKIIPVENLNVDRWSVITSFWDNYFSGEYAYFAKSTMNNPPGPMPFYFVLALPFYLIGELGYFSILGLILFYLILRFNKSYVYDQTFSILIISSSVFFLWEVCCRSNIFLNGSLVLFVLVNYYKSKKLNTKKIVSSSILIGLCLSTRNVLIIPIIVAFVYELKSKNINFKQVFLIGLISSITFIFTFLPFVWKHFEDFKQMNPFIIQSSALMPFRLTIIFILFSLFAGLITKSIVDIYFYSGFILFITIIGYYCYHFWIEGFHKTFFDSSADISYFILGLPFSLFYILEKAKKEET